MPIRIESKEQANDKNRQSPLLQLIRLHHMTVVWHHYSMTFSEEKKMLDEATDDELKKVV